MRILRWLGVWFVVGLISLSAGLAHAQSAQTFTLQPGGKATVTFEAFCVDFGKKFPANLQGPSTKASDPVQAALAYAQSKNLTADEQQALQVQYAIWQLLNKGGPKGDATTQDVIANAKNPPAAPQGTSLLDAAQADQVKVTLNSWQPIGEKVAITAGATDHFYGRGQLTVENTSQQALALYMPVGTVFPAVSPSEQSVAGYATNVEVNNPQQESPLPQTSSGAMLPLIALGLLGAGAATRIVRRMRA